MVNPELGAPAPEGVFSELSPIVRYHDMRNPEAANYVFPEEFLNYFSRDSGQRLRFHPLCEVVDGHHEVFVSPGNSGKRPQKVYSPLGKGPRTVDGDHLLSWLVTQRSVHLTRSALLN